nr:MAG TPA: hypothetical protein [Caudoviricetes sp.]
MRPVSVNTSHTLVLWDGSPLRGVDPWHTGEHD